VLLDELGHTHIAAYVHTNSPTAADRSPSIGSSPPSPARSAMPFADNAYPATPRGPPFSPGPPLRNAASGHPRKPPGSYATATAPTRPSPT
jgi:hypothetical protein